MKSEIDMLQEVCRVCLSQESLEAKLKAEHLLADSLRVGLPGIIDQLERVEQNTIFVVAEVAYKNEKNFPQDSVLHIVQKLIAHLAGRVAPTGYMLRGVQVARFVEKSLYRLLAVLLKKLYLAINSASVPREIEPFWLLIQNQQLGFHLKLQIWVALVDCISTIDPTMGYLQYRNLTTSFQQNIITKVAAATITAFKNRLQKMMLQFFVKEDFSSLKIDGCVEGRAHGVSSPRSILDLGPAEGQEIERLVQLLVLIVDFNYNLTYSEYDMERTYENCIIGFPDGIVEEIVDGTFVKLAFFLAQRFVSLGNEVSELLYRVLFMLQKVALCRLTNVAKPKKKAFLESILIGANFLMKDYSRANIRLFTQLIDLNCKFIINVPTRKLRKFPEEFGKWLENIASLIMHFARRQEFSFGFSELFEALQLWKRIGIHFQDAKLKDQQHLFRGLNDAICSCLLQVYFSSRASLFAGLNHRKIKKMKKSAYAFFGVFKYLCMHNSKLFINAMAQALQNPAIDLARLLLMGQAVALNSEFVEKVDGEEMGDGGKVASRLIAELLRRCLEWAEVTRTGGDLDRDVVLVLFSESFMLGTVARMQVAEGQLCCNSVLFREAAVLLEKGYQFFLEAFLNHVIEVASRNDAMRPTYCLQLLNIYLIKLKYTLRREEFKSLKLTGSLFNVLLESAQQKFVSPATIKLRRPLFKLIVVLGFDDLMDNYNACLDQVMSFIQVDRADAARLPLLYSLRGIAQNLQVAVIYRRFITKCTQFAYSCLLGYKERDLRETSAALKLVTCLLENKSHRLSNHKNQKLAYQMVCLFLPVQYEILKSVRQSLVDKKMQEVDSQLKLLLQIWRCWLNILKGAYLNYYLLGQLFGNLHELLFGLIESLQLCQSILEQYPKLEATSHELVAAAAEQILLPICQSPLDQYYTARVFLSLIHSALASSRRACDQLLSTSKNVVKTNVENVLVHSLDSLNKVLDFVFGFQQEQHYSAAQQKTSHLVKGSEAELKQVLEQVFQLCFRIHTRDKIFSSLCQSLSILLLLGNVGEQLKEQLRSAEGEKGHWQKLNSLLASNAPDGRSQEAFKGKVREFVQALNSRFTTIDY